MPKFNVTATLKLKNALNNLAMTAAFSKDADFSGISDVGIEISEVIQKTVLEVLETGTVPGAISSETTGITTIQEDHIFVEVDHPFIFYIRDDDSGLILLQGKMTDPTQNEVNN
ncbi:unnamed protein product [Lymnaea stagnalis]|uniref:Serpin domain-containing protein n=1 Tax=Lymnaea stagnalis TaxID=6523 RepID=A0AAV2ILK1_LYMST